MIGPAGFGAAPKAPVLNNEPRYPEIHVRLTGNDGNAFTVLGKVTAAMRKHNIPKEEITSFTDEAMSGDYNNLLRTCMRWVEVA